MKRRNSLLIRRHAESGVALLIAIFVLMLVSVVAIALLLSSGTETALSSNYRSSASAYYAALAGLEEARGRLLQKNPNYFNNSNPNFIPAGGLGPADVRYIVNPLNGEDVLATYPDNEYGHEFPGSGPPLNPQRISSISGNNAQNLVGPLYKWVRINAITEKSLNIDVTSDGGQDDTTQLLYDGSHLNKTIGKQALEITALAVLPNGTQKMLQYVVAPPPISLPPLLAALTLSGSAGNVAAFSSPASNSGFSIQGNDYDCSGNSVGGPGAVAIGALNNSDAGSSGPIVVGGTDSSGVHFNGIQPPGSRIHYTGSGGTTPDVEYLNLFPDNLKQPSQLDMLVQSVIQNADAVLTPSPPSSPPPYLGTVLAPDLHAAAIKAGMSSSNPVTVVINGNLDISNWGVGGNNYGPGYGLLLVTGTFTYDPDTNWNGIIFVIGQGIVNNTQHGGSNAINGAVFVAKTRDSGPGLNLLPSLGGASVRFDDTMQGNGIRYSSCWVQKTTPVANYKVLSFHEIPQ